MKHFLPDAVKESNAMKEKSAEDIRTVEALLSEMPVEPSEDFSDRVLADFPIDTLLREMPIEPSKDFAAKTLAAARTPRTTNVIRFLSRFAVAASVAVVAASALWLKHETGIRPEKALAFRIEQAVQSDPELSLLASADDDSLLLDELLAASEILSTIDPSVLEIFAYND